MTGKWISFVLVFSVAQAQDSLCGTNGHFCAENFTIQMTGTNCGKYSDVFSEPNVTMSESDVPLVNYTFTNTSEVIDNTVYLSEVLKSKAYELYSEQQDLFDGVQSCQSNALKTEFTSIRLNSSQCTIDVDDVLATITPVLQEKWLLIHYGKTSDHPAKSCQDLFEHDPSLPSGNYWLKSDGGDPVQMYCDMDGTNCDGLGGWMRLYKLDLVGTDSDFHTCPGSNFDKYAGLGNGYILCRRVGSVSGCRSAKFSVNGLSYSKVCGKASGIQKGTTDAFYRGGGATYKKVDDNYVDGISVTHGSNPRTHIFTFAAGCSESSSCWSLSRCPCQTGQNPAVPTFIGHDDFYCEAGSYWHPQWGAWYKDLLWDGKDCAWKEAPCCSVTSTIPWFMKNLPSSTTDEVEIRVCTDENSNGEDVGVSQLEIYVKA